LRYFQLLLKMTEIRDANMITIEWYAMDSSQHLTGQPSVTSPARWIVDKEFPAAGSNKTYAHNRIIGQAEIANFW
jgi:hypothetical protein